MAHGAESIEVHHHIQDACSTDGTAEFLEEFQFEVGGLSLPVGRCCRQAPASLRVKSEVERGGKECPILDSGQKKPKTPNFQPQTALSGYTFSYASEPDNGMYDAINRGVLRTLDLQRTEDRRHQSEGEKATNRLPQISNSDESVVAWLNCDEQYLPGTLHKMFGFFEQYPNTDIMMGDVLLVNGKGGLVAFRKGYALRRAYVEASHLYTLSCATFFRQHVFDQSDGFDTIFQAAADEAFMLRALRAGFRARHVRAYLSAFTFSGENLGAGAVADQEHLELKSRARRWVRILKPAINTVRRCEKWLSGAYVQRFPLEYAVYSDDLGERKCFSADRGTWRWPGGGDSAV